MLLSVYSSMNAHFKENKFIVIFKIIGFRSKICPEPNTMYQQNKTGCLFNCQIYVIIYYVYSFIDR